MNQNEKAIAALLANDQETLNQSDTNSVMKLYASDGVFGPEANQELFFFHRIDDTWKIARYCFSTTIPPRA